MKKMIQVALRTEFKLDRKLHSTEIIRAVHENFLRLEIKNSLVYFMMEENAGHKTSSIERVLKQFPEMRQFDHSVSEPIGREGQVRERRRIGNDAGSPMAGAPVDLVVLLAIAAGVPKRFPLFRVAVRITSPIFGDEPSGNTGHLFWPGLTIVDKWGLSKRQVALTALAIVEADPASNVPPAPPDPIAAVLKACGRHSRPEQIVLPGQDPDSIRKAAAITRDMEHSLGDVVIRARMPHDFSMADDHAPLQGAGPFVPALTKALRPLGYDCRGDGMMVIVCRRRTPSGITIRLLLDFGTWGRKVDPTYFVHWFGFSIAINLPVCPRSGLRITGWIVDEIRWQQIVENLAALVEELDRTVLPVVEKAAGPTPSWYEPGFPLQPTYLSLPLPVP